MAAYEPRQGQVCALTPVETPPQQHKASVDLCEGMACLDQGEKAATSLFSFRIFEWSLSVQR